MVLLPDRPLVPSGLTSVPHKQEMPSVVLVYCSSVQSIMSCLLSAFKPMVPISIQAWLLLKHTDTLYCESLSTAILGA